MHQQKNKRYLSYIDFANANFGGRLIKVPLDAGFSCPTVLNGSGGCIFCTDALRKPAPKTFVQLQHEYTENLTRLVAKWPNFVGTVAYLQSGSNTFAQTEELEKLYSFLLKLEHVKGISIATRPDCLAEPVLDLLELTAQKTFLTVELGLQTSSDRSAKIISRGYDYSVFLKSFCELKKRGIRVCVHIINGLPEETVADMLKTVKTVADLKTDAVKIHLMHILDGTPLAGIYQGGGYAPMQLDEYAQTVARQISLLPPTTVVERLTGDGDQSILLAPSWSRNKKAVFAAIERAFKENNIHQGDDYEVKQIFTPHKLY